MKIVSLVLVIFVLGCSSIQPVEERVFVEENAVPGTVKEPWSEPIYDTVKVPAQLDPTGTYYRPTHQTVVEIRPGRVQPLEYPEERKNKISEEQWQR